MTPAPNSGAWRPGDPFGQRKFAELFASRPHALEAGGRVGDVTVAYETWGTLNSDRSNAV
ncbi:MAG: hypothetical protein F2686_07350 [Actinobacteria bacterium]|nr:hypothetical protein [Actinomycetota bacterium]